MSQFFKFILIPLILGAMFSCASHSDGNTNGHNKVKDDQIKAALDSISSFEFSSFYARISTDYEDTKEDVSFKTSVRIAADSAISVVITFVRIPVASALITTDSMKVSNKRDKCYIEEDLEYLAKTFGVDFDYNNVEELLLGLPMGYDSNRKYFRVKDPTAYTFCTHKKNQLKLNEKKPEPEVVQYFTLSDDLNDLKSMKIHSPADTALINVNYLERELVNGHNLPRKVEIRIHTAEQIIKIDLEYKRMRLNEEETIHFVIPDSYEKCK